MEIGGMMYASEARMLAAKADKRSIILKRVLAILREEALLGNTSCTLPLVYSGIFVEKELTNMGYYTYSSNTGIKVYWDERE